MCLVLRGGWVGFLSFRDVHRILDNELLRDLETTWVKVNCVQTRRHWKGSGVSISHGLQSKSKSRV